MAALLNVNTIENNTGGTNTSYLSTPLQNMSLKNTTSLATGVWYRFMEDTFIIMTRNPTSGDNYCYYSCVISPVANMNTYIRLYNQGYTPMGGVPSNTMFVPKGMWFQAIYDGYGNNPNIWVYSLGAGQWTDD